MGQILPIHHELIQRCRRGERKAQFKIYDLYVRSMLNIAYRIVNNEEDAKDIIQASFLKAFRQLDQFKQESTFGAWLKRIVINHSINHLKKRKLQLFEDMEAQALAPVQEEEVPANELTVEAVKEALSRLPDGYRTILSLYLIEGYDHQEIAQILDISASTSMSQYHRGKKKLISILNEKNGYGQNRKVLPGK